MSNAVFPVMPGLTWDITRIPVWSTTIKQAVSGREFTSANFSYPRYRYKMVYSVLRQNSLYQELSQLVGFFNARQGSFDSFLFTDPDDNTVTLQAIGIGDGANKLFQLVRSFGGYVEPVYDVNGAVSIYVNGVLRTLGTDYAISSSGLVTFVVAPGAGLTVAFTGSYYRRMRFEQDTAEFSQFMKGLWELRTLQLLSKKP